MILLMRLMIMIIINNKKTTTSKSFKYEVEIIGSSPKNTNIFDAEVAVPLKYLSNFWKFLICH